MKDWTSFFLTGAHVLPVYMVAVDEDAIALAFLLYFALLLTAMFAAAADEDSPARKAVIDDLQERKRKDRRQG